MKKYIKVFSSLLMTIFVAVLFLTTPSSPCACITHKMKAMRIFKISLTDKTDEQLLEALYFNIPIGTDKNEMQRKYFIYGLNECTETVSTRKCTYIISETILSQEIVTLTMYFNEGKLAKASVAKIET